MIGGKLHGSAARLADLPLTGELAEPPWRKSGKRPKLRQGDPTRASVAIAMASAIAAGFRPGDGRCDHTGIGHPSPWPGRFGWENGRCPHPPPPEPRRFRLIQGRYWWHCGSLGGGRS